MAIELPDAAKRAQQEAEMRKIFRLKVALEILGNEELHKLAAGAKDGAAIAHDAIKRATQVVHTYLNEDP